MKKIMVTGGSGFIGSNFIRYMVNKYPHYMVVNYDKLTYAGNPDNLADIKGSSNYEFVHGDIDNIDRVIEVMGACQAVVNFAAETHVDRSIKSGREFMQTNVLGTHTMLEAARYLDLARFLHVSTDEVYGSTLAGSFTENDRLLASSPYSVSKAAGDLLCYAYKATYDLPVIVTRSSNNFGPYQYPEKLIPLLITNALIDKFLPIYGDGKNVRDWIYVEDNCTAIDLVLHQGEPGETYNIGAGNEVENLTIAKKVLELVGKGESLINFVPDRLGHDRRYSIATEKIKELGWQPRQNFEEALEKTVNWYVNNQSWWKKLKEGLLSEV